MVSRFKKIKKGFGPTGAFPVYKTYLSLLIMNRFLSPVHTGIATLLSAHIEYSKRAGLYGMFKEIFIDQNYFIPYTKAPLSIIDCGTNIGISLLYFRTQAPNASIMAFEPNPHTYDVAARNIKHNNLKVELHNVGVGSKSEQITFFTEESDLTSQSASKTKQLATKNYAMKEISVQIEPLSQYITKPVDILKLDIEGAEGEVIAELVAANKLPLIKKIFVEYHFDGVHTVYPLSTLLKHLEEAGFIYVLNSGIELPYEIPKTVGPISYKIVAWQP